MTINELIEGLTSYQEAGLGEMKVVIWEKIGNDEPNLTTVENFYFKKWKDGCGVFDSFQVNLEEKLLLLGR